MKLILLGISILIALTISVSAQNNDPGSTQFLYDSCKSPENSEAHTFCLGYVEGVGQLMVVNGYELNRVDANDSEAKQHLKGLGLCPDSSIGVPSGSAMIQAFLNWTSQHPESWNKKSLVAVAVALRQSWPCE